MITLKTSKKFFIVALVIAILLITGIPILFNTTSTKTELPSKDEMNKFFYEYKDKFQTIVDTALVSTRRICVSSEGKYWNTGTTLIPMNISSDMELMIAIENLEKTEIISDIKQWDIGSDKHKMKFRVEFYKYYPSFHKNTDGYNVGIMYIVPNDISDLTLYTCEHIEGNWYYYTRPVSSTHFFS